MGVWNFEAGDIAEAELPSRPIYRTPAIEAFLRSEKSEKRIISGFKGTGKTLFLRLISQHYRRLPGVILIPKNQLTDRLYSIDHDFSSDKAKAWGSGERWKHVWRTVLSVIVLKAVGQKLSDELSAIFPETLGLSVCGHLSEALRSRVSDNRAFQDLFPKMLDARIQAIAQPVALFVDNIDEALYRHSGYDLYRDSITPQPQLGTHSYDIWVSAQIGFVHALRELSSRNEHLKLFGTVRGEAIRDNQTPTAFNVQAMVLDLQYTPSELRGIFDKKLRALRESSPDSFARHSEPDAIKAFFPIDTIEHRTVKDDDGCAYREDIFEYLRRHTRGRPRELDLLGYRLEMIRPKLRTPEKIREIVEDLSQQFFGFAKNEAIPFWDPKIDVLINKISTNFILREDAEKKAQEAFADAGPGLWRALYENGLCGAVVNAYPRGMEQRFAKHDGAAELTDLDFKSARIWVMHPCVNIAARPRRTRYEANRRNVAGHGYPFVPVRKQPKKHLHVLIGAGKLGFGLVVPRLMMDRWTNLLIIARPSADWQVLLTAGTQKCMLQVNSCNNDGLRSTHHSVEMMVVTDKQPAWQDEILTGLRTHRCALFFSSTDASMQTAISLGDSIGISVGPSEIDAVVKNVANARGKARFVLGYENDEAAMQRAARVLSALDKTLIFTVVDRICTERKIAKDAISIKAECYGTITAYVDATKLRLLPPVFWRKPNADVRAITEIQEFDLVREKKKRLVNSLHAAAAALVLKALMDAGARPETADDVLLGLVAKNMDIHTELLGVKELMILSVLGTLQPTRLSLDVSDLIRELHEYGEAALKRMLDGPDAPSRVLKTDIHSLSAKYNRLFADVQSLAVAALRYKKVQSVLQIPEIEIKPRLDALKNAFLTLLTQAGSKPRSDKDSRKDMAVGAD